MRRTHWVLPSCRSARLNVFATWAKRKDPHKTEASGWEIDIDCCDSSTIMSTNDDEMNANPGEELHQGAVSRELLPPESDDLERRAFVSRHRQTLDHIAVDSVESRRHEVPSESGLRNRTWSKLLGNGGSEPDAEKPRNKNNNNNYLTTIENILPCLRWMREYKLQKLWSDLIAGLTVGVMIVPQSELFLHFACQSLTHSTHRYELRQIGRIASPIWSL